MSGSDPVSTGSIGTLENQIMKKLIRIVLTLAVGCTGSIVSISHGQLPTTPGKGPKFKVKGDRVVLRDKSKPVLLALA